MIFRPEFHKAQLEKFVNFLVVPFKVPAFYENEASSYPSFALEEDAGAIVALNPFACGVGEWGCFDVPQQIDPLANGQ